MTEYLSEAELASLRPARELAPLPIPTYPISNGEFYPARRTDDQRRVAAHIETLAQRYAPRHGLSRRSFLHSAAGMASAFVAMNLVYGGLFDAPESEAATPGAARERADALASQWIVDLHTHFLRDDAGEGLQYFAKLRDMTRTKGWNPALGPRPATLQDLHLNTYIKEIWLDSDTKIAALSGAPSDIPADWFLTNSQIARARDEVNAFARSRRLPSHFIFTPGQPGWLEAIDRGIEELKPDAWKGYTIGDNTHKESAAIPGT